MSKYIIRLDDACPTMNQNNWDRMERILDKYGIHPIVGVIPENRDLDFSWERDPAFWEKVKNWKNKGWTIALHGLHHQMHYHEPGKGYYQKSHGVHTEYAGEPFEKQLAMLEEGMSIFKAHDIIPECFFAPAHTYDKNTVNALKKIPEIKYISDGYALKPYKKNGMIFVPSICDGPFTMPTGMYTYVFHPSVMKEENFARLESFLDNKSTDVIDTHIALTHIRKSQGIVGVLLENSIYIARGLRSFYKTRKGYKNE